MTTPSLDSAKPQHDRRIDDIFFFDSEKIRTLASESIIANGIEYFKENRVTDLILNGNQLQGYVEGSDEQPYRVSLEFDKLSQLDVSCQCSDGSAVCKHAVALLYQYAAEYTEATQEITNSLEEAIEERLNKGRTEVKVVQNSGELWFGSWEASSIVSSTHRPQTYKVQIRSLNERRNYCTCPDFAVNQLGTCKHIEAVLYRIQKDSDYHLIKDNTPSHPLLFLDWEGKNAPKIKLIKTGKANDELNEILNHYFDAQGYFDKRLPDDFYSLTDALYGHGDIQVGEDVITYVQRLAADLSHKLRAKDIQERISQFNGVLPWIKAKLYSYQIEGVAFLAGTGRCLLADDMGLGKTLQAISAATWLQRDNEVARVLIVCPASLKHQWAREIERFTGEEAQIIQGNPGSRQAQYRKGTTFTIVNYELVLRDLSVINEVLRPDLLILDEAQRIKNWRTKIASTIKLIPTTFAFVLTGTPLENRLEDLYSLMQVVNPHVLGPLWKYLLDFHITDERSKVLGYRNLGELRRRIQPVMLRRDRRLVRDQLPDRIETRLDVPMNVKQRELHDSALSAAGKLAQIAKHRPLTPAESKRLMSALQTTRMACNSASLVDEAISVPTPKLEELAIILDDLCLQNGLKVVVFSQWERMTRMVEERIRMMGIGSVRLHGGVPTAKRGELMDRFMDDDAVQVFISTDAGGVGLNLQSASALINLDIPWNPAVLEQRIARIHRLGQKNKVQIIKMVAEDSYEENVLGMLMNKQHLFNNVIDPEAKEDVVGVSKRMLEALIEDLSKDAIDSPAPSPVLENPELEIEDDLSQAEPYAEDEETAEEFDDEVIRSCVERIQVEFGPRIERIMGSKGAILVIMAPVTAEDDALAVELSRSVPVALMEPRTWAGLQRLSNASPVAGMETMFEYQQPITVPSVSPFLIQAKEKLKAAEALLENDCSSVCLELIALAMVTAVTALTDETKPPTLDDAAVWIYSELLPRGIIDNNQANVMMQAISMKNASNLTKELVVKALDDASRLVGFVDG
ncbi:DEAD/DEAH box helicase [bacterium]|nr:DEAD/DEAH box helicase [bacterium]